MDWCFPEVKSPFKMPELSFSSELDCGSHTISISKRACFFLLFLCLTENLIIQCMSEDLLVETSATYLTFIIQVLRPAK